MSVNNLMKKLAGLKSEPNKFGHLMVDIETMGHKSSSAIISIGAVEFDIETGETGAEFYRNVSLQSCIDAGLKMTPETVMWWMQQTNKARADVLVNNVHINHALYEFAQFCNKEYQIWGNSVRFDLGILENACDAIKMPICWDFRKERCVRTLVSFCPEVKENHTYNALADCYNQIDYCSKIWNSLSNYQNKQVVCENIQ
jgi:hypothetical protein